MIEIETIAFAAAAAFPAPGAAAGAAEDAGSP
jgi:hypothetical protein